MISGQSKNGVLASHADLSQLGEGVISYRLEFGEAEAEEGKGTELVPHTNILLKAEQVRTPRVIEPGQMDRAIMRRRIYARECCKGAMYM